MQLQKDKIKKYYEFVLTKFKLLFLQRTYRYNAVSVKYILKKQSNSDILVVVLSSCTRPGIKARYNYMRTLSGIKVNQLFILDDFGLDRRGSYYLGRDNTFCEEKATKSLIDFCIEKIGVKKLIFCGSSKGGYAALDFGLQYKDSVIIAGAPQYHLAKWYGNSEGIKYILGDLTEEKVDLLDNYLKERVLRGGYAGSQKIRIHYSDKEHTYNEHIKDLIGDLKKAENEIIEDVEHYDNHSDVSLYFPKFLVKSLQEEIS